MHRHRYDHRGINDCARFADRRGAIAQGRARRADIVKERHSLSRNAGARAHEASMCGQALRPRATSLRVARALFERAGHSSTGDLGGVLRDECDAVDPANASACRGRRNGDQQRVRRNQMRDALPERFGYVATSAFEREDRGSQTARVRAERSNGESRQPHLDSVVTRGASVAQTAAERVA